MSATPAEPLVELLAELRATARRTGQRRGLVLGGPEETTRAALSRAWAALDAEPGSPPPIWLGLEQPPPPFVAGPLDRPGAVLGRTFDTAIIDLYTACWPDMLGAVAGAVAGGGLLIIRTPPRARWLNRADARGSLSVPPHPPAAVGARFPARLARVFDDAPGFARVELHADGRVLRRGSNAAADPPPQTPPPDTECRTADQAAAVAAVLKVATGRRKRPVVLLADRGRGKSAALGIAAGRLLRDGALDRRGIALIAPDAAAVEPVLAHARRLAGDAVDGPGGLRVVAPAELALDGLPAAGLILVDEAAALPVDLLSRVVQGHPRVAFSTTVHGYEGTGRGFAIRFTALLDAVRPHWRRLRLETPIRYRTSDPVEAAVFRGLLLDAAPVHDAVAARAAVDALSCAPLDRDALASDEPGLSALFGLLVAAHYRTSPADLERLLDGPNVAVWAARDPNGAVIAAALVTHEGGLDAALSAAIHRGERRPTGHMLPETLAAHLGLAEAPRLGGWRVVRIAVHPAAWGRGVGSALIEALAAAATRAGVDYIGSAFGATPRLLRFWQRAGFAVARVGLTRGRSSGLRSAVVLRPLSDAGRRLTAAARRRFAAQFPLALGDMARDMAPGLVGPLFTGAPIPPPALTAAERLELRLFADGRRVAGAVIDLLWRIAPWIAADRDTADADRAVVVAVVLQRRSPTRAADALGLAGRRAVSQRLGAAIGAALDRLPDRSRSTAG